MHCALAVALLGLVSPGAAQLRVSPLFFPEKELTTFFAHHCHFYRFHSLGCHPLGGCHPAPFLPVRLRLFTILCKFAHKHFFRWGVTNGGCHPGRSAPSPLVTPLCTGLCDPAVHAHDQRSPHTQSILVLNHAFEI